MNGKALTPESFLVAFSCPKCGGPLGAPDTGTYACEYCGTELARGEVWAGKPVDLQKFYERASEALENRDYAGAYEYFKRILETDNTEYQAWVGKGLAGAYVKLRDDERVEAAEVLSCLDMALAYYPGEDREAFERSLADRLGALALGLFEETLEDKVNDQKNLRGCLELLYRWEAKGSDEPACWKAIVAVAEKAAVPPKKRRQPGTTYLTFNYPFKNVAKKYTKKIRAKYEPEFKNMFERGAETQRKINLSFKKAGTVALIVVVSIVAICLLCVVLLVAFGFFSYSFS